MGIQREGYQTVQSAGKTQKTCRWHIWSVAVAAEGEQWLLAGGQITGRDASGLPHPPRTLHPSFSSFGSSSLFICLFIIFPLSLACFPSSPFNVLFAFRLRFQMINKIKERVESSWVGIIRAEMRSGAGPSPRVRAPYLRLEKSPQDTSSVSFRQLSAAPNFY